MANPKKILAKAWDNRYGCGLAIELLKELKDETLSCQLYSGATVQEEVGLRGAEVAANMIQPDLFFALDASPANDVTGDKSQFGQLGKGALLRIYDRTMITHRGMREFVLDTAETNNIPYQYFVSPWYGCWTCPYLKSRCTVCCYWCMCALHSYKSLCLACG